MKNLKSILVLFVFMGSQLIYGQKGQSIEGQIIDKENQNPVAFANVALYNQNDSSLVKGAVSDDKGRFSIADINPSKYYLKVSYVGYKGKLIDGINLSTNKKKYNIGNINISPADKALDEVVIKEDRLKGQEKVDRTVYNINNKVKSVSGNGLDVLKYIPAVHVDLQENVTLEGRSDILFFVDDIKQDKDFITQIDPNSIDRVEIMTNPSVKYDADISGVIHIYLKKEKRYGVNGKITVEIPSPPNIIFNPGFNLDYGFSNFRIYVSDRLHYERFNGYQQTNTIKYTDNIVDQQIKSGDGIFSWSNNNLNYGFDWFVNDKNTLNFFGNYKTYNSLQEEFVLDSRHLINDVLTDREEIDQDIDESGISNYFSLFYKKKFEDEGKEFTMQTGFYDYRGNDTYQYSHRILDISNGDITDSYYRENLVNNNRNSADLRADYSQNFKNSSLEAGINSYYQWINNTSKPAIDVEEINFVYDEFRQSAYVNYTYKFKKLTLQSGLRTEFSETNINNTDKNQYLCWLPQLSLKRKLEKSQSIKLNLRRRIFRPGISDLNPFEIWYDSLHISKGNPNLKPSYSNDMEFVYSKNFESSMISPKIYAKYRTNTIHNVHFIDENNVTVSLADNIGESWEYGLALNGAFKITKWWQLSGFASIYNKIIYSDDGITPLSDEKQEKVSFQVNMNSIMTFFKSYNFMMMMNYRSPYISYQTTTSRDLLWIVGLEKTLFKNGKLMIFYLPPYTKRLLANKLLLC